LARGAGTHRAGVDCRGLETFAGGRIRAGSLARSPRFELLSRALTIRGHPCSHRAESAVEFPVRPSDSALRSFSCLFRCRCRCVVASSGLSVFASSRSFFRWTTTVGRSRSETLFEGPLQKLTSKAHVHLSGQRRKWPEYLAIFRSGGSIHQPVRPGYAVPVHFQQFTSIGHV
jgi:hypothetical protein